MQAEACIRIKLKENRDHYHEEVINLYSSPILLGISNHNGVYTNRYGQMLNKYQQASAQK